MLTAQEAVKIAKQRQISIHLVKFSKKIRAAARRGNTVMKVSGRYSDEFWDILKSHGYTIFHDSLEEKKGETYVSWM